MIRLAVSWLGAGTEQIQCIWDNSQRCHVFHTVNSTLLIPHCSFHAALRLFVTFCSPSVESASAKEVRSVTTNLQIGILNQHNRGNSN